MWNIKKSPPRLEKRFKFDDYKKISLFLEKVDNLCKISEIFPNISFGKNFVSFTIFLISDEISKAEENFTSIVEQNFRELTSKQDD